MHSLKNKVLQCWLFMSPPCKTLLHVAWEKPSNSFFFFLPFYHIIIWLSILFICIFSYLNYCMWLLCQLVTVACMPTPRVQDWLSSWGPAISFVIKPKKEVAQSSLIALILWVWHLGSSVWHWTIISVTAHSYIPILS